MVLNNTNSEAELGSSALEPESVDIQAITARYEYERDRRLRSDAQSQYEELEDSSVSRLESLAKDPFVDHEVLNARPTGLVDGQEVKFIICMFPHLRYSYDSK